MKRMVILIMVSLALSLFACTVKKNETKVIDKGENMKGTIVTKEAREFKIHSYLGYSGDVTNILELDNEIIVLDPQPTYSASKEVEDYVKSLNKEVKLIVISSHGIGINNFENARVVASQEMVDFMNSDAVNGFIEAFTQRFGDDMIQELVKIDGVYSDDKLLTLNVKIDTHSNDYPPCSDIRFENSNVVFTHLSANQTHMLLSNPSNLSELIAFWKSIQDQDFVISSHLPVIEKNGIAYSLKYVETAKEVFNSVKTKDDFMATMQERYPNAGLEFFLAMTADNFYK